MGHIAPAVRSGKEARRRERDAALLSQHAAKTDNSNAGQGPPRECKSVVREYALFRIVTDRRGDKSWVRAGGEVMVCSYDEAAAVCKAANRGR